MTVATPKKSGKGSKGGKNQGSVPRSRVRRAIKEVEQGTGNGEGTQPDNGGAATTAKAPPLPETPPEPKFNFAPIEVHLNALMRGEQPEVTVVHTANALLGAIACLPFVDDVKIQALAYVLANHRYAKWSGEPTPADNFYIDGEVERAVMEMEGDLDTQWENVHDRLALLKARIKVEKPDELGQAKLAWEFLESLTMRIERIHGFMHLLLEPLVEARAPFTVVNTQSIPDEIYDRILWNNRRTIEKIEVALRPNIYETRTAMGEAILEILTRIENERDRAVVAGYAFELVRRSGTGPNIGRLMMPNILEIISGFRGRPGESEETPDGHENQQ